MHYIPIKNFKNIIKKRKIEGTYVYLWRICVDVWQKPTQHWHNYPLIKINKFLKNYLKSSDSLFGGWGWGSREKGKKLKHLWERECKSEKRNDITPGYMHIYWQEGINNLRAVWRAHGRVIPLSPCHNHNTTAFPQGNGVSVPNK